MNINGMNVSIYKIYFSIINWLEGGVKSKQSSE